MKTLKEYLDRLYKESEVRNEENRDAHDCEAISCELAVQSNIKEILDWLENNSFSQKINDLDTITLVRVE